MTSIFSYAQIIFKMSGIKTFIFVLFWGMGFTRSAAQSAIACKCTMDSTFYQSFLTFLDTTENKNLDYELVETLFLSQEQNNRCKLLIYTKLFDYLLNNNLDLGYSYLKERPAFLSGNVTQEELNESAAVRLKDETFKRYFWLKGAYEDEVVICYESDKKLSLEEDVNNILGFNIYAYPATLKGILLTKNAKVLKDNYYKEVELIMGKD